LAFLPKLTTPEKFFFEFLQRVIGNHRQAKQKTGNQARLEIAKRRNEGRL
jgi:hypothetical protein